MKSLSKVTNYEMMMFGSVIWNKVDNIKHLVMVSARFCEIYFTMHVLLYTFKGETRNILSEY